MIFFLSFFSDPEYLSFDVSFEFCIPRCCQTSQQNKNDYDQTDNLCKPAKFDSTLLLLSSESDYFSEVEQKIATEKVLNSLVAPKELNESMFCF